MKISIVILFSILLSGTKICAQTNRLLDCTKSTIEVAVYSNADTSLINVTDGNVYDTALCVLQGVVLDFNNNLPVKNVEVSLADSIVYYTGKTDENGHFRIVSHIDLRSAKLDLHLRHPKFQCLVIKNIWQSNNSFGEIIARYKLKL